MTVRAQQGGWLEWMRARIAVMGSIRRLVLPVLTRLPFPAIRMRNAFTGDRLTLHPIRHKSYWYWGKEREAATMAAFARIIRTGDVVIEIGAHVGAVAQWFSHLVGAAGNVISFEPGPNNLTYLRKNAAERPNIRLVEAAVAESDGLAVLHVEDLSGQNNSLIDEYAGFAANRAAAAFQGGTRPVQVPVRSLDSWCAEAKVRPDFVKIDVEGAEAAVLAGMKHLLVYDHPPLMVEVTRQQEDVYRLLREANYRLFSDRGQEVLGVAALAGNVFCIHIEDARLAAFLAVDKIE